ncbi:MAG: hypothetical protein ACUVQN_03520 [Caldisericia bacterium]
MLSSKTKELIKEYYKKCKSFEQELNSRMKHREEIFEYLKEENIKNLDEFKFGIIISKLWATQFWSNKDYIIKTIIEANGITKIKEELYNLLYGNENIDVRYDRFKREIKYLGTASITEILCLYDPNSYGIWNDKAMKGIEKLEIEDKITKKYSVTGKEYLSIINILKEILYELKETDFPEKDLLGVDNLLFCLSTIKENHDKSNEKEFDHDYIRDKILEIGNFLGFETSIEKLISTGARIDVIWEAKIANLGLVRYVFEVHKKGSIDSLILNLQKALNNPTVQKLIVATTTEQIEIIKQEIKNLPENFRKSLTFWSFEDIIETYDSLSKAIENIKKLSLIKSEFEYETES